MKKILALITINFITLHSQWDPFKDDSLSKVTKELLEKLRKIDLDHQMHNKKEALLIRAKSLIAEANEEYDQHLKREAFEVAKEDEYQTMVEFVENQKKELRSIESDNCKKVTSPRWTTQRNRKRHRKQKTPLPQQ